MKITSLSKHYAKTLLALSLLMPLLQCSDEQLISEQSALTNTSELNITDTEGVLLDDCSSCSYVVPETARIIDGEALGIKPGSVIGLDARFQYGTLLFRNLRGTFDNPIVIRNCGGVARVNGTGKSYAIKTEKSQHFRITGGKVKNSYGIVVTGGTMGINLGHLSTQFEVDHVEVQNVDFAGIMAKTDPGCDPATWRANFLMKGVAIHNNYVHDTGGEGLYIGNSFFMGMNTACGVQLPHEIHYIRIYSNIVRNTGWEAIQLGCATRGASIHGNTIENYGLANKSVQNNGIQIGAGTGGVCYNNYIKGGTGNGMIIMGLADNIIHNNIIEEAGNFGIFCDERYTTGPGFKFINNTILNPKSDGIRIYADEVEMNVIVNNVIANPGSYLLYSYPRKPEDAFIYRSSNVNIDSRNNYFTTDSSAVTLTGTTSSLLRLMTTSPLLDQGADISEYGIKTDFNFKPRLRGSAYDIGAIEQ